ncbi:uncharacterized protein LOC129916771 [Episyrphus balteatus]|uniref:uncharacterized protein LOC129916771 n=1 Tax=Episyrphus balteatus TaxID=286459 RepID=UPI002486BC6E|nr:uncharacterized protein LOC129916771 [Episyrphus balteatus]
MLSVVLTLFAILISAQVQCFQNESSNSLEEQQSYIEQSGCLEEGVTMEEALEYTNDDKGFEYTKQLVEKQPNLKCYSACIFESRNLTIGCIVRFSEELEEDMDENELKSYKQMHSCASRLIKLNDRCECAYEIVKCLEEFKENEKNIKT